MTPGTGSANTAANVRSAPAARPQPDKAAILEALAAMFEPGDVIELRAFNKGKKRTHAGYFDGEHWTNLADAAMRLNRAGAAVYVTLNRVNAQLLGRYCNRIEEFAGATTSDHDVTRRCWLLIDFDPVRPKDTSATDAQLAAAREKAQACRAFLRSQGWPEPLHAASGNGAHLLYRLDLPNDEASRDLVKGALAGLAAHFDDDTIKVDQSVFNAARIVKLYGCVANKGDHAPLTPWRLSAIESAPPHGGEVVTTAQLRALHTQAINGHSDGGYPRASGMSLGTYNGHVAFDLEAVLARLGIAYTRDLHGGRERFKLAACPFNPEHVNGEAAIFRSPDGTLGFKCQHNSCTRKGWRDVRALLDGPRLAGTDGAGHVAAPGTEKSEATDAHDRGNVQRRAKRVTPIDPSRPVIECRAGERAKTVGALAKVLADTRLYYRRDAAVVRIVTLPAPNIAQHIRRAAGAVVMRCADAPAIVSDVSAVACTARYDMRAGELRAVDLPKDVALSLISTGAEDPAFQPLTGIMHCPIVRGSGEFVTTPGYDTHTGLYLAGSADWSLLTVPARPTRDDAQEAAHWLMTEIYGEYRFVGDIDQAVVLSSVLTAVIRPVLDTAPVHGFDAPSHGIGKSMLAEIAGIIATGVIPPMLPVGETKEETMKRVTSAILAGDAIVVLDNVSEPLTGDALCVAMTAATVSVRPLGSSAMMNVPSRAFWMVTGANLRVSKDMVRRTVIARVDPQTEHPEQRTFNKPDLKAWVLEHRLAILSRVLTILRAHAQHRFPSGDAGHRVPPLLGSFEQWSRRVAHCLLWLGYENPVASQARLGDDDPARIREDTMLSALLDWQDAVHFKRTQHAHWQVSDVRAAVSVAIDGPAAVLRDSINDACKHGLQGFPYWLRGARDRIVNGKRLVVCEREKNGHTKVESWKVVRLGQVQKDELCGGCG